LLFEDLGTALGFEAADLILKAGDLVLGEVRA
jgi:hypothetical protein